MAETGVRAGELLAMTVADVDLDRGQAIVRKAKGGKQRRVPFGSQTVAALDRYLRARRRVVPSADALWVGVRGYPLGYHGLNAAIKTRAKAAGINNFHLHLLRHTCATRWLRAGGTRARFDERGRLVDPRDAGPLHVGQRGRTRRGRGPHPWARRPAVISCATACYIFVIVAWLIAPIPRDAVLTCESV